MKRRAATKTTRASERPRRGRSLKESPSKKKESDGEWKEEEEVVGATAAATEDRNESGEAEGEEASRMSKRPRRSSSRTKSLERTSEGPPGGRGPVEERKCPHCGKVFSTRDAVKYHVGRSFVWCKRSHLGTRVSHLTFSSSSSSCCRAAMLICRTTQTVILSSWSSSRQLCLPDRRMYRSRHRGQSQAKTVHQIRSGCRSLGVDQETQAVSGIPGGSNLPAL